jgi:exopolysaccharide production protein ExoQ
MELDVFTVYAFSAVGLLVLLATAYFAYTHPRAAVPTAFLLVLLADTKFRIRGAAAALSGDVDGQILLELGLYGLIATISLFLFATSRNRRTVLGLQEVLLCGYVLVCITSSVWSVAPTLTIVRSFQVLVLLALVQASVRVIGSERTMRALTASGTLYVLICSALVVLLPQLHSERVDGRFGWFAVHPISAGSYAAIAALCVLSIGIHSLKRWHDRILWCPVWFYPLPLITVLLLTVSRGPLLAFIGGAGILLLKRLRPHVATVVLSLGFLMILAVIGSGDGLSSYLEWSQSESNVITRQVLRGQTLDAVLSLSGRAELWENMIGPFYQQPLNGYGYQASRSLL